MNIVNKRWLHFHKFASDMSLESRELTRIVSKAKIGKTMVIGKHRLLVHKMVQDKHGRLYTLSLMNEKEEIQRLGPVYINKPSYHRRLIGETFSILLITVLTVASVGIAIVFVNDIGEIIGIQESCKIASLEVIKTGADLGFMRIVIQNDSDQNTVNATITDPLGDVKFDDGLNSTAPWIGTPLPKSEYIIDSMNDYYNVLSARDTVDIGERISTSHKQGESVLLQVEVRYNTSPPNNILTCTAGATIR